MDFYISGDRSNEEWEKECDEYAASLAADKDGILQSLAKQVPPKSEVTIEEAMNLLAMEFNGQDVTFSEWCGIRRIEGESIVIHHPRLIASLVDLGVGFSIGCNRDHEAMVEYFLHTDDGYDKQTEMTTVDEESVDYDFCNVILANLGQVVYESGFEVDPMALNTFKAVLNRISYVREYSNGVLASVGIENKSFVRLSISVPMMAVDQCQASISTVFEIAEKVTLKWDAGNVKIEFILPRVWKI